MTTPFSRAALAAAAMAFGLSAAHATTTTTNLTVSLTVTSTCAVSATPLNFLPSTATSNVDATATISVICGSGTPYSVTLGDGQHPLGVGLRQMQLSGGGGSLEYSLFSDPARTVSWSGATAASGTGTGSGQSIPVYARVPASVGPTPGAYSDTVQITVTY